MRFLQDYLRSNRGRLELDRYGLGTRPCCVALTPRFRASSHVVFLVLGENGPDPVLVAKVPRLCAGPGDSQSPGHSGTRLHQEFAALQAVQSMRPCGFSSIPRVVAFESFRQRPVLLQTAIVGRPMDPGMARRRRRTCCRAAVDWLADLQGPAVGRNGTDVNGWLASQRSEAPSLREAGGSPSARPQPPCRNSGTDAAWHDRLVTRPIELLAEMLPSSEDLRRRLERTRELVEPLRDLRPPLVVEHGDLSPPNVMLRRSGGLGVVDWELADPRGLPGCDLFFFLTYVAFSRHKARANGRYVPAYHQAFFGRRSWVGPVVREYAARIGLPHAALGPLLVLCWVRYLAGLLGRLRETEQPTAAGTAETVEWLQGNRYYAIWGHTVDQLSRRDGTTFEYSSNNSRR